MRRNTMLLLTNLVDLKRVEKAKELCIKVTKQQQIFLQGGSLKQ
jgi:hypothetical protein